MKLTEQINSDIKNAMLAKDKDKLAPLRAVKAEILLEGSKGGGADISDDTVIKLIQKLVKQRKDALEIFLGQARQDLVDVEQFQIDVLATYLPKQMDESEVRAIVQGIIEQVAAASVADIGKVMGSAMSALNGKADGKLISTIVKEELSK